MSGLGDPPSTADRAARAVVTGGAGFIGSHLIARLTGGSGTDVVAVDNERSGDWSRVLAPVERVHEDLGDLSESDYASLCAGADVVFHLAAEKYNSSKSSPQRVIDVNVSATQRLLAGAAAAGVRKVVFTSSLYAYGSMGPNPMRETDLPAPTTTYGMSKVAGEHLLRVAQRDHGLAWSVARLFFVYGPKQYAEGGYKSVILSNFERIRDGSVPTIYGDGEQMLDYVFIDDVTDALVRLASADHDGRTFNIGSGRGVTVNELTARMLHVAGAADLEVTHAPPDWTAGSARTADADLARDELGWSAVTDLDAGLRSVWNWMTDRG